MKKLLKFLLITIILLVVILAVAPFLFQDKIEQGLKNKINENLNADVEWKTLNLSLLSDFPNAEIALEDVFVTNKKPFEGDTLFYANNFQLHMGLFQLFNPDNIVIDDIDVKNANLNILINEDGQANYDIQKKTDKKQENDTLKANDNFSLKLKSYAISNTNILYKDADNIMLKLDRLNHEGKGDFSKNIFTLETQTNTEISLVYDQINYLKNNIIDLEADIEIDLDEMKFTFKDNIGKVNQLPLNFEGFVQIFDNRQEMDIKFTTPDSDFKNLLALIPQEYSGNLDGIKTKGDFSLDGRLFGIVDDTHIPKIDIELVSKNAEFQYDDLPNKMENINLDMKILNSTGLVDDTAIDINKLDFRIGEDNFSGSVHLKDITENIKTDLVAKGVLNLTELSKTYPLDADLNLNGVLNVDLETHFDINSLENEQYQNIDSNGTLLLTDFKYQSGEIANPFEIKRADLTFNQASATLKDLDMNTGQTDIKANGQLENLIGYLFSDGELKGNFQAMSNKFVVNDFMTTVEDEDTTEGNSGDSDNNSDAEEAIKIPSKLDLALNFTAKQVLYDNFNLKNMVGKLSVKDQKINLSQIQANLFGGQVIVDGNVSTKEAQPNFGVNLKLNQIDIGTTVEQIEMFKGFTPIFQSLVGIFSTELDFGGDMTSGLSPILTSLDGNGLAKIIQANVKPDRMPLANTINSRLELIDISNFTFKDLVTSFSFENGSVQLKPLKFIVDDIEVNLQGSHSIDKTMNYSADIKLPGKYLDDNIKNKLSSLTKADLSNMLLDIPLSITGELKNPKVTVDTQTAINELTNQIINNQKNNLINQAGNKLNDIIDNNTNTKDIDSTSTQQDSVKETVKNVLGGMLGGKKNKEGNN